MNPSTDSIPVARTIELIAMRVEDQNGQQQVTVIAKDPEAAKLIEDVIRAASQGAIWNVLTLGTGTRSFSRSTTMARPHEPIGEAEAVRDTEALA